MQKLLFSHIFGHHFYELFRRFIHVAEELSARGIHVPSAAEHFPGKDIYRSVTLAAERYLGFDLCISRFGFLVRRNLVLAHKDGVIYVFDLQRHIHYALHIARFGVEAVHLTPVECDECGVVLGENFHLMIQAVSYQSHSVRRIGVEHAVVDGVLVDTCCEQHGYNVVHLRLAGVVGEVACVGHHSRIDAGGKIRGKNGVKRYVDVIVT